MESKKLSINKSQEYWARAINVIPAGTQTFSKGPTQYVDGVAPKYLKRGQGCHVWDIDGNEFIDYGLALGPVTLGYCYPAVDNAIKKQLADGITFSLMHPLEVELSERLIEIIPCAEMVRFGKNGSDATSGAIRCVRAYTGREKIACCGYHGWQDWYIGTTTRCKGVPQSTKELTLTFNYNDIKSLERIFEENPGQIAGVIMEAIVIEEPKDDFLQKVKDLSHKNGAVLIFDEIVNGFRIAIGGAQEYYKVVPDLATFGKGMANGMPISVIAGKKEIMREFNEVFFSFTFGGEVLSLAAAMATINVFKSNAVIKHFHVQGSKLKDGYNKLVKENGLEKITGAIGLPEHSAIFFNSNGELDSLIIKSLFQQELIKRGILTIGVQNICYSLNDSDIKKTLEAYNDSLKILNKAIKQEKVLEYIEGGPISPIFKRW